LINTTTTTRTTTRTAPLTAAGRNHWGRVALAAVLTLLALVVPATLTTSSAAGVHAIAITGGAAASASLSEPAAIGMHQARVAPNTLGLVDRVSQATVNITAYLDGGQITMGTDIALSSIGFVLTNDHVIARADYLDVTDLGDGRTYRASVLGADAGHDIALLQLRHAAGLHTATLGNSNTVHTDDIVISIGNAYGLGHPSVGIGPVTHLHRTIPTTADTDPDADPLADLIEADNNIQPGESGGPMLDQDGRVIGVNVAYLHPSDSLTPTGTGYAIPINTALRVAHHLLAEVTSP